MGSIPFGFWLNLLLGKLEFSLPTFLNPSWEAVPSRSRRVRSAADTVDEVSVYTLVDQQPGAFAEGPAIVEGPFYTARVLPGWTFEVSSAGDLLLTDLP